MTPTEILDRALSACGKGIQYKLGHGGWNPAHALPGRPGAVVPADKETGCDCSGFVAWVLGKPRSKTIVPGMWGISTDSIHRAATAPIGSMAAPIGGRQLVRLSAAEPGCIAVYPDYRGADGQHHEGHVAIVVDPARHMVIDCGSSSNGISERAVHGFWTRADAVFCRWAG